MKILFLEILLLLLNFNGVSLEEISEDTADRLSNKASVSISYADLQKFSLDSDSSPSNSNIYFDYGASGKSGRSHLDFENEIKQAYSDKQEVKVHLNDLIRIVRKGIINEAQATLIWDAFTSNARKNDRQAEIKEDRLGIIGRGMLKWRNTLDGWLATFFVAVLFFILAFILLTISFTLYGRNVYIYIISIMVSGLFVYNFRIIANDLYVVLGSRLLSSLIYNANYVIVMSALHSLFCAIKLHTPIENWSQTLEFANNYKGKFIYCLAAVLIGYFNAYQSDYFLLQFPFYFSSFIVCSLIGARYYKYFPGSMQPLSIFIMSLYSALLLIYLFTQGSSAFNLSYEVLQKFVEADHEIIKPDFQFTGYAFASSILLVVCPLYLFIQHQRLGENYIKDNFSYKEVFVHLKEIQTQALFSKAFTWQSLWLSSYGFLGLILLYVGFRVRIFYVIILTILGLQSFIGIVSKERGILNTLFFYSSGFIAVNATFLMGKIEDTFSDEILCSYKGGWVITLLDVLVKVTLNYFSLEICSANFLSLGEKPEEGEKPAEEEKKQPSILEVTTNLFKFSLNYLFAVYLLSLAETEESWLNSLIYSISAIYFFTKVLFYSALTKDVFSRLFIAITIFLAGTRIALLSYNLSTPFYFGTLLSQFSIFATYISFKLSISIPMCLSMFTGVFLNSVAAKSPFMMIVSLINLCGFLGMIFGKTRQAAVKVFLGLLLVNCLIIVLSRFNLDIFYNSIDSLVNTLIPEDIMRFLRMLYNRELLAEQNIAKRVLEFFYEIFGI